MDPFSGSEQFKQTRGNWEASLVGQLDKASSPEQRAMIVSNLGAEGVGPLSESTINRLTELLRSSDMGEICAAARTLALCAQDEGISDEARRALESGVMTALLMSKSPDSISEAGKVLGKLVSGPHCASLNPLEQLNILNATIEKCDRLAQMPGSESESPHRLKALLEALAGSDNQAVLVRVIDTLLNPCTAAIWSSDRDTYKTVMARAISMLTDDAESKGVLQRVMAGARRVPRISLLARRSPEAFVAKASRAALESVERQARQSDSFANLQGDPARHHEPNAAVVEHISCFITRSAIHEGTSPRKNLKKLEELGLKLHHRVRLAGAAIDFSDPFRLDEDGRIGVMARVHHNGKKYVRVFYLSNSSAAFRLLPAINEIPSYPGLDKGGGEYGLALPCAVQEVLFGVLGEKGVREGIPEEAWRGAVHINRDLKQYWKREFNAKTHPRQLQPVHNADTQIIPRPNEWEELKAARKPEQVVVSPEKSPDYSKPIRVFRGHLNLYGDCTFHVYHSQDKSLEYLVVEDPEGRIFFGHIGFVPEKLNIHGLPPEVVYPKELGVPLYEYFKQIPDKHMYAGRVNENCNDYYDAWRYLKGIPIIQAWYRQNGRTFPE